MHVLAEAESGLQGKSRHKSGRGPSAKNRKAFYFSCRCSLKNIKAFLATIFLAASFTNSVARLAQAADEIGFPLIQNFTSKDYGGSPRNWAAVQDHRGVMYFGNGVGLLQFDGARWRLLAMPNRTGVFSLGMDKNGRIYIGAYQEIGYLAPDSVGRPTYISLVEKIPENERDFGEVWKTFAFDRGIGFMANQKLFLLIDGQIHVIKPRRSFHICHAVNGKVFIRDRGVGLMHLQGDSLVLANDGARFANEAVYEMLPFDETRILTGTRRQGFFLYDGQVFTPFEVAPEITSFIEKNRLYVGGGVLDEERFVLISNRGGFIVMDRQGKLLQHVDKAAGLLDDTVWNSFLDRQGGLWLMLNNGLSRVEILSPLTQFDARLGLETIPQKPLRHRDTLYVETRAGAFFWNRQRQTFQQAGSFQPRVTHLLPFNSEKENEDMLLAATGAGVFEIKGGELHEVRRSSQNDYFAYQLHQSKVEPSRLFVGLNNGLASLRLENGVWVDEGKLIERDEFFIRIYETRTGDIWAGLVSSGAMRVSFPSLQAARTLQNPNVVHFNHEFGLPKSTTRVAFHHGRLSFETLTGLYHYDEVENRFFRNKALEFFPFDQTEFPGSRVYQISSSGQIWLARGREHGVATPKAEGGFRVERNAASRLAEFNVTDIYPEKSGVVWLSAAREGLFRYATKAPRTDTLGFRTLLSSVSVGEDSLIYGGFQQINNAVEHDLPFSKNSLHFSFAAASYDGVENNRYQVFLEGFDEHWSHLTEAPEKEYTNLSEGDYRFRVRAENVYRRLGREAAFAFTVLPPWYRTIWAYTGYFLLATAMILGLIRLRMQSLRRRTKELEALVAEKTQDVKTQRDQLREQAKKLQEMDQVKSRFFANISHEFRTPLTLVLGQIDSVLPKISQTKLQEQLAMAHRNGRQVLRLINQLLDLSKFDSGAMKLNATVADILPLLKNLTYSFESLAHQKKIKLKFECEEQAVFVNFESEKIEQIMHNLLSNAMKFTPEGGKVSVQCSVSSIQRPISGEEVEHRILKTENSILITVRDSGAGIPKDRLPHIFDRFYQVDGSQTREHEGSGIGLALTKELVELHGGEISVESEEDFGTTFFVRLPFVLEDGERGTEPGGRITNAEGDVYDTETANQQKPLGDDADFLPRSPSSDLHSPTSSPFVLVVEDNADVRAYIRQHLEERYRVIEAGNGEKGLEKAKEFIPDLIITDVMMPKIDGYELSRMLRGDAVTSHIPIIMLTAKAAEDEKLQGLETGVDAYLIKPFSTKELNLRVEKLIEMRRNLREQFSKTLSVTPVAVTVSSVDEEFFESLKGIIEESMSDESFGVDDLCEKVGMSRRQLQRKISALTDRSPAALIRTMRMQRAKQLLEQGAGNVTEIAYKVGYSSISSFSRVFRQEFGKPPKALLKSE